MNSVGSTGTEGHASSNDLGAAIEAKVKDLKPEILTAILEGAQPGKLFGRDFVFSPEMRAQVKLLAEILKLDIQRFSQEANLANEMVKTRALQKALSDRGVTASGVVHVQTADGDNRRISGAAAYLQPTATLGSESAIVEDRVPYIAVSKPVFDLVSFEELADNMVVEYADRSDESLRSTAVSGLGVYMNRARKYLKERQIIS